MPSQEPSQDIYEELLTAYVLGALSPEEMQQVSTLLQAHPELHQQLAELRRVTALLPYGLPEAIPAEDLRERVLARARGEHVRRVPPPRTRRISSWIAGLSAVFAAVLLAWTIQLQLRFNAQQTQIAQQAQVVAALAAPGVHVSTGQGSQGSATFVHSDTNDMVVAQLPRLESGRTYQLWLLKDKTSTPSSAGTFVVDQTGRGMLLLGEGQQVNAGSIFAITNEPSGGSPAPTTDILVSGTL